MKGSTKGWLVLFCALLWATNHAAAQSLPEKWGWKLGMQAYTFRKFSFFEAVDKIKALGLKYVEAYPGQKIGGEVAGNLDYKTMDATARKKVLDYLKSKGVTLVAYGVNVPKTAEEWKALFEFSKQMGIRNITAEPLDEHWDLVSRLCDQYKIYVAIHNHPQPSHYWHPDSVLTAVKGRSRYFGACADIGHWTRSGLNAVDCLKKYKGHIVELHFKDVAEEKREAHDVPFGTGKTDIAAVMQELKHQDFKGVLSIEYENHPEDNMAELKQSIDFYHATAKKLK